MGLFSSKYITSVGTSVSRVIKDDALPDSIKTGSIKALLQDGDYPEYTMEEMAGSLGIRAEKAYRYAESHYTYGLPSGEVYSSTQGRTAVEAVIEAAEGQQVLMQYSHFGPPNTLHIGWVKLIASYGYSPATNQIASLSAVKGVPVYLKDMVVVVPSSQVANLHLAATEQWDTAAGGILPGSVQTISLSSVASSSPLMESPTATTIHLLVTYVWLPTTVGAEQQEATFTIETTGYDDTADYFHAKYTVGSLTKYWMYRYGSGTYPTLDSVFTNSPVESGNYFPFLYFRYEKHSTISDKTTDGYKTSKKLAKIIGLDYDQVGQAIDENPDVADVEQAMMVFGVPSVSTDSVESQYLFEYFDQLFYSTAGVTNTSSTMDEKLDELLRVRSTKANTIIIKDARFKMALSNNGIYKRMVAGTIGAVGTHANSYETVNIPVEYVDTENTSYTSYTEVKVHRYKHQISPGLYEEVIVQDLKMLYYVFGDYTTTGDGTNDILLIPIDKSISSNYSTAMRETLYARSLHCVFNSRVVTKLHWYQTGIFQAVLLIIAIVMTVIDLGTDGGSWIATVLELTGTAAIVATVIFNLVVGQLLTVAFRLFVKVFGAEFAQIIAVIALLVGAYQAIANGAYGTAQAFLQLSTGLQQAALQSEFSDLLADKSEFDKYVAEQTKTLDTAKELLQNRHFLEPTVIFGEKPEQFYNRTVHFGNIGTLGITAISSYVDIALTLPKLKDTLGEDAYGNDGT